MMQKLKQLYWRIFFPKKFKDLKNPEKAKGCCQQCAYKFLSIKQNKGGKWERRVVCLFDKSVHDANYTCDLFKDLS